MVENRLFKLRCWNRGVGLRALLAIVLTCYLTGCGRVMVVHHLRILVEVRSDGDAWRMAPGAVEMRHPSKAARSQFPYYVYSEPDLDLDFGASGSGIGFHATNRSAGTICFRVDQARVSSNFAPTPVPLTGTLPFWPRLWYETSEAEKAESSKAGRVKPPPLCAKPGEWVAPSFQVDVAALFPSGQMFDVAWPDNEPKLTSKGIGNWVRLELPIERDGRRIVYRFTATNLGSEASMLRT